MSNVSCVLDTPELVSGSETVTNPVPSDSWPADRSSRTTGTSRDARHALPSGQGVPHHRAAELPGGTVRIDAPELEYEMFGPAPEVQWLWPGRIPLGMVTLIEGSEGAGKSFVALDVAARVSRGAAWPEELRVADAASIAHGEGGWHALTEGRRKGVANVSEQSSPPEGNADSSRQGSDGKQSDSSTHGVASSDARHALPASGRATQAAHADAGSIGHGAAGHGGEVLVICRGDESRTASRRLMNLGADFARIRRLKSVGTHDSDQGQHGDRPIAFPADLPAIERELKRGSFRLIVIDSLADFCRKPQHVADALGALNELAERYDVAIVVTLPSQCRIDGQGALRVTSRWRTGGARCVWCVVADPEDPARRILVARRTSFCDEPQGLELRLEEGRVVWRPEVVVDPADPLGQHVAIGNCLEAILRNECQPAPEVYRLGGQCGFTPKQLRRAAKRLGIESHKSETFGGGWVWYTAEQRAEVVANVCAMADRGARDRAILQSRLGDREEQRRALPTAARDQPPQGLAGPFWMQPDGTLCRPVVRRMSDSLQPTEPRPTEPAPESVPAASERPGHRGTAEPAASTSGSPTRERGPVASGNFKSEESLEKRGEIQPVANLSHGPLPRERYARRQERKRRLREVQNSPSCSK